MSTLGRIVTTTFKLVSVLAVVCLLAGLAYLWTSGAWHLVFPSSQHDEVAPALPARLTSPAILVFSKTNGFRHIEGIAGGRRALTRIAAKQGWTTLRHRKRCGVQRR